jgi:hypothetical protein
MVCLEREARESERSLLHRRLVVVSAFLSLLSLRSPSTPLAATMTTTSSSSGLTYKLHPVSAADGQEKREGKSERHRDPIGLPTPRSFAHPRKKNTTTENSSSSSTSPTTSPAPRSSAAPAEAAAATAAPRPMPRRRTRRPASRGACSGRSAARRGPSTSPTRSSSWCRSRARGRTRRFCAGGWTSVRF